MTEEPVPYDAVWRRIKTDPYAKKFEGRFPRRFSRLDRLNNWGVLSWLYPHATATKQAHHLGVERNAGEFLSLAPERAKYRPSLRTAAHVMHWGHPPLSYAAAEALLRAAHVNPAIRTLLSNVLSDVVSFGELDCENPDHDGRCAAAIRSAERPFELYRWLAAWLVHHDWTAVWSAIKAGHEGPPLDERHVKRQLVRTLVCHDDPGFELLSLCNLADFVPRDLLQCGTAWLTVDIEALWEGNPLSPVRAAREWTLLMAARDYLHDRFYGAPTSLLAHTLAARAIAQGLLARKFGAKELRALLDSDEGDLYFDRSLPDYHRNRLCDVKHLAFRDQFPQRWRHVGTFSGVSVADVPRLEVEATLTRRTGSGQLSYPFNAGFSVVVEDPARPRVPGFAGPSRRYVTVHLHHRANPKKAVSARPMLDIAARMADLMGPLRSRPVGDGLMAWLLGSRVEQRAHAVEQVCGDLILREPAGIQARVRRLRQLASLEPLNAHYVVGMQADALSTTPVALARRVAGCFILRLPWVAPRTADGRRLLETVRERALAVAAGRHDGDRGRALEVAIAADQWLSTDRCDARLVLIGATALDVDGKPSAEWDVIRLDLTPERNWTLSAIESAVTRSESKDREARDRFEIIREALQGPYGDLARYSPRLATVIEGELVYEDAGRGFTRDS